MDVLQLTASRLSPLSGFESHPGHVRKLPVTWVRRWFPPGTPVSFTSYNWLVMSNEKQNYKLQTLRKIWMDFYDTLVFKYDLLGVLEDHALQ